MLKFIFVGGANLNDLSQKKQRTAASIERIEKLKFINLHYNIRTYKIILSN